MRTQHSIAHQGFTLLELSIALVIIGLIVGGVLVGKDLIHAASVRATVGQIEKYNAAVNTFRTKYNGLPGDMIPVVASTYGLFALSNPNGGEGMGDNNGVIEDGSAAGGGPNQNKFAGEISTFWRHLSDANLVDGQFGTTGNSIPLVDTGLTTGAVVNIYQSIPPAKMGHGISITIISGRGTNYYYLFPVNAINSIVGGFYTAGLSGMSPIEAQNIDAKIDDGQPNTGIVLATSLGAPGSTGTGSPANLIGAASPSHGIVNSSLNDCVIGDGMSASDYYNVIPSAGGNDPSCGLAIRFQ